MNILHICLFALLWSFAYDAAGDGQTMVAVLNSIGAIHFAKFMVDRLPVKKQGKA